MRPTLAFMFLALLGVTYLCFFAQADVLRLGGVVEGDSMHEAMAMTLGVFSLVMAVGAGLAFLNPQGNASIITLLILLHFAVFIKDVVFLVEDAFPATLLIPEMVYLIVVCIALIRYFPAREKEEGKEEW